MSTQTEILRACNHSPASCEVNMGRGGNVCCDCWNASVAAGRDERKKQLAGHWQQIRQEQEAAMQTAGATIGQRVYYFAPSMLGLGGFTIRGTIKLNRNKIAVVRLDYKWDGHRETEWTKAWKPERSIKA